MKIPKRRSIAVVFSQHGNPYKPKVVKSKKAYTRKEKHKGRLKERPYSSIIYDHF